MNIFLSIMNDKNQIKFPKELKSCYVLTKSKFNVINIE